MKPKSKPERQQKQLANAARETTTVSPASCSFPIVGIGESAGELEAFTHLQEHGQ